jgi:hypothetical protein
MDGLAIAGVILQFLQFSCTVISRSQEAYKSSQGSLAKYEDVSVISHALLDHINRLKVCGWLAETGESDELKALLTNTEEVATELLSAVEKLTVTGPHKKWSSFKAAILSVRTGSQVQGLETRRDGLLQAVQLYLNFNTRYGLLSILCRHQIRTKIRSHRVQNVGNMVEGLGSRFDALSTDLRILCSRISAFPKPVNYLAQPEDHVNIDDGLGQNFVLPVELCSTPEVT